MFIIVSGLKVNYIRIVSSVKKCSPFKFIVEIHNPFPHPSGQGNENMLYVPILFVELQD